VICTFLLVFRLQIALVACIWSWKLLPPYENYFSFQEKSQLFERAFVFVFYFNFRNFLF
jgi:hypothetical protein